MKNILIKCLQWSADEERYIYQLRDKNTKIKDIHILLNEKFKTMRTIRAVNDKIAKLYKIDYNKEMDKIIISYIRKYPTNLQFSFKESAKELNKFFHKERLNRTVTYKSVEGRYYSYIRVNYEVIAVGSGDGFSINVKNKPNITKKYRPKLRPVLYLMREILNLSAKDRKELIHFLNQTQ